MKKLLLFTMCVAVIFVMSKVSFAQDDATSQAAEPVGVASSASSSSPTILPFGYPPYPTVGNYPAYGAPYSYPRAPRRLGSRLAPPTQFQPYPLPAPGAVPGDAAPVAGPVPPTFRNRLLPPRQGVLGAIPATVAESPETPVVVYRPTPVKNFMTLMSAPRPYIGYDPYAGQPPAVAPPFVAAQEPVVASDPAPAFVPAPPPPFGPER